jgi:hypothetical protein
MLQTDQINTFGLAQRLYALSIGCQHSGVILPPLSPAMGRLVTQKWRGTVRRRKEK